MIWWLLVATAAILIYYRKNITYWVVYYLAYKFSGAHQKPTSDSKYDPAMVHINHPLYKLLRKLEDAETLPNTERLPRRGLREAWCQVPDEPMTPVDFLEISDNKTNPVVMRGFIKDTQAVKTWDANHFLTKYGETKVLTLRKPDDKQGGTYTSFNEALDFQNITLSDSIRSMTSGGDETLYVNNVTQIFYDHPELVDELELDQLKNVEPKLNSNTWLKINLFMGGPDTGSSLHCAVGGNFFFNICGKKKWILIPPEYFKFLRSTPSKDFEFAISGYDIENPSEILNQIPKWEVILEPGDVLFIPPWWWHYVKNETDFTIGCAVRDHTIYKQSFQNNWMFMLMSPYPFNLNPWVLKLANRLLGRKYLIKKSMKSDRAIVDNLTNYTDH